MAYGFNDDRSKAEMYTKDEVYKKTETYPKTKLYDKDEIDDLLADASTPAKQGSGYAVCSTAAATAAKTATLTDYKLVKNGYVSVCFVNGVTDITTLNINNKGAKNVYVGNNKNTISLRNIKAGDIATFVYDGTAYRLVSLDRDDKEDIGQENADLIFNSFSVRYAINNLYYRGQYAYGLIGSMYVVCLKLVNKDLKSNRQRILDATIPLADAPSSTQISKCRTIPTATIEIETDGKLYINPNGTPIPAYSDLFCEIAWYV